MTALQKVRMISWSFLKGHQQQCCKYLPFIHYLSCCSCFFIYLFLSWIDWVVRRREIISHSPHLALSGWEHYKYSRCINNHCRVKHYHLSCDSVSSSSAGAQNQGLFTIKEQIEKMKPHLLFLLASCDWNHRPLVQPFFFSLSHSPLNASDKSLQSLLLQ